MSDQNLERAVREQLARAEIDDAALDPSTATLKESVASMARVKQLRLELGRLREQGPPRKPVSSRRRDKDVRLFPRRP